MYRQLWVVFANDIYEGSLCTQHQTSFLYVLAWVADGFVVCLLMIFMSDPYVHNTKHPLLALQGRRCCKKSFACVLPQ